MALKRDLFMSGKKIAHHVHNLAQIVAESPSDWGLHGDGTRHQRFPVPNDSDENNFEVSMFSSGKVFWYVFARKSRTSHEHCCVFRWFCRVF